MKEKCWSIKENRPIDIFVDSSLKIKISPVTMTYNTANFLDMNHRHCYGNDKIEENMFGVELNFYDYENGEAQFSARSKKDVLAWSHCDKYNKIINIILIDKN